MDLRTLDLNLLVAFDALMAECHVTRAAVRMGVSQPAMSNTLTRLRSTFQDELLVRTPAGMEPTGRAHDIWGPVRRILKDIEKVVDTDQHFKPSTSSRAFRVRMGDVHGPLLLQSIASVMQETAPNVSLNCFYLTPAETVDALEKDDIDVAITLNLDHPKTILSRHLYHDRLVCICRKGHPICGKPLTLDQYMQLSHVKVGHPSDNRFIDQELSRLGLSRKIPLQIHHWLAVTDIVLNNDLVSATWERIARRTDGLVISPLPFGPKRYAFKIYWHRRYEGSAPHRWLRDVVLECGRKLDLAPNATQ